MPTILVVDDSAVERRLITGLLQQDAQLRVEVAENGLAALEKIGAQPPALVLTDLRMPDMDGLALVREMVVHYSNIPVILMTAHGNESVALDALRGGAATYIPKAHMDEMLMDSVRHVLAMRNADRSATGLMQAVGDLDYEFELATDPALVEPLVRLVQQAVSGMQLAEDPQGLRMGIAVEQALLNALYRGNLEISAEDMEQAREDRLRGQTTDPAAQRLAEAPYCERKIFVRIDIDDDKLQLVVRDEGPGFDVAQFANVSAESLPNGERGRGFVLMRSFMDEVTLNDRGNEITLIKYRSAERSEHSTDH